MVNEDIVMEKGDGLREDGVVMVEGRSDDPVIKDRVSEDIDLKDFPLGDGETEEMDGDLVGRGV